MSLPATKYQIKHNSIDLTNKQFGRLTVLERSYRSKDGRWYWRCICSCGKEAFVASNSLGKNTNSCGCLQKETRLISLEKAYQVNVSPDGYIKQIYTAVKTSAATRNLTFNLTKEQVWVLAQEPCFYCNCPPSNILRRRRVNIKYSGIDRVDNSIGYEITNVVACCVTCNLAKRTQSLDNFLRWIKDVYETCYNKNN